jgi:hypothetical protein
MPVFQVAAEVDDGAVGRNWGSSSSTSNTGGIDLTVTLYADGNLTWGWTPISGQQSYLMVIKNNVGTVVWAPGCGGVQPDTSGQSTSGEPLYARTDGPFTMEVDFYNGPSCTGTVIASATASGFDYPDNTWIDNNDKLFIGDASQSGTQLWNGSAWIRFTSVNIPQGTAIEEAILTVQAVSKENVPPGSLFYIIRAEDSDNVTTNPSSYDDYWTRTRTGSGVSGYQPSWDPGVLYEFDITPVIQEVINRSGWSSGNSLLVFFADADQTHVGSPTAGEWISINDYPSLSAPQLTVNYSYVGTAAGSSTATAETLFGVRGDADGQSVADAFGAFSLTSVGSAAGSASTDGVGASEFRAVGTSAGSADADGADGRQGQTAVGSNADGTSTANATTEIEWVAVGTSDGSATTNGVGLSEDQTVGSSTGSATANGVAESEAESAGASAGVGSAPGVGESEHESAGTSAGQADADDAVGLQGWDSVGSSDGVGAASGVGLSEAEAVGSSDGSSTATAERAVLIEVVGSAAGVAVALAGGSKAVFITGESAGTSKAVGRVLTQQRIWLQDLSERLGIRRVGQDSARFLELNGAIIIEPTAFEPDPATHRESHYYNAMTNTLYRRVVTREEPGVVVAHWQKVSD